VGAVEGIAQDDIGLAIGVKIAGAGEAVTAGKGGQADGVEDGSVGVEGPEEAFAVCGVFQEEIGPGIGGEGAGGGDGPTEGQGGQGDGAGDGGAVHEPNDPLAGALVLEDDIGLTVEVDVADGGKAP